MQFSDRFLGLVQQQVSSFEAEAELENVVVYVAKSDEGNTPSLEIVGQMKGKNNKILTPIENDPNLRAPSPNRRWYPLQDGSILLGVLRAERSTGSDSWPELLDKRLQASAASLANCLCLELERKRLFDQLNHQSDQIRMLVHQLRNPLSALKTYAQLLLKKIDPESIQRNLVEGLLTEQEQFNKYLVALDEISDLKISPKAINSARLLLPPFLSTKESLDLRSLLEPLIERASATANLQGRKWLGPVCWPEWINEPRPASEGVIPEIVANLLENAFRYSPSGAAIGLHFRDHGICVWDAGNQIPLEERQKIFEKGYRSKNVETSSGSGLGLTLGRQLANQFGGNLELSTNPSSFDESLPEEGNAFVLTLPAK